MRSFKWENHLTIYIIIIAAVINIIIIIIIVNITKC